MCFVVFWWWYCCYTSVFVPSVYSRCLKWTWSTKSCRVPFWYPFIEFVFPLLPISLTLFILSPRERESRVHSLLDLTDFIHFFDGSSNTNANSTTLFDGLLEWMINLSMNLRLWTGILSLLLPIPLSFFTH